jgi:hypothetical protein
VPGDDRACRSFRLMQMISADQKRSPVPRYRRLQFRLRTLLLGIALVALLLGLGTAAVTWIEHAVVRMHQTSVAKSLRELGTDYSHIQNDQDAFRAVDSLRCMEQYYLPSDGYRSDPSTEAALQTERSKAMAAVIESLERYTGEHHGWNLDQWEAWRKQRDSRVQAKP